MANDNYIPPHPGKKISELPVLPAITSGDIMVGVDVESNKTVAIKYDTIVHYNNFGTSLDSETFQDAITELALGGGTSAVSEPIDDGNTYIRKYHSWVAFNPALKANTSDVTGLSSTLTTHISDADIHFPISAVTGRAPAGGTAGWSLVKDTDSDFDYSWKLIDGAVGEVPGTGEYIRHDNGWTSFDPASKADATTLTTHTDDTEIHFGDAPDGSEYVRRRGSWHKHDPQNLFVYKYEMSAYPTNTVLETHTDDATKHYLVGDIHHGSIQDIGTNTHANIDTHIEDTNIHFQESDITGRAPAGGSVGQALVKDTTGDYEYSWKDVASDSVDEVPGTGEYIRHTGGWTQFDPESKQPVSAMGNYASTNALTTHTNSNTIHFSDVNTAGKYLRTQSGWSLLNVDALATSEELSSYTPTTSFSNHTTSASIHFTKSEIEGLAPTGGSQGMSLVKTTDNDFEFTWQQVATEGTGIPDVADSKFYLRSMGVWSELPTPSDIVYSPTLLGYTTTATTQSHVDTDNIHYTDVVDNVLSLRRNGVWEPFQPLSDAIYETFNGYATSGEFNTHTNDATIHYAVGDIDHADITNIGSNTHTQIDTHISSADIHIPDVGVTGTFLRSDNSWTSFDATSKEDKTHPTVQDGNRLKLFKPDGSREWVVPPTGLPDGFRVVYTQEEFLAVLVGPETSKTIFVGAPITFTSPIDVPVLGETHIYGSGITLPSSVARFTGTGECYFHNANITISSNITIVAGISLYVRQIVGTGTFTGTIVAEKFSETVSGVTKAYWDNTINNGEFEKSLPSSFTTGQFLSVKSNGDKEWASIPGGGLPEVPAGSDTYARKRGEWVAIDASPEASLGNPTSTGQFLQSTIDGTRSWATIPGGGIGDTPAGGSEYIRSEGTWTIFDRADYVKGVDMVTYATSATLNSHTSDGNIHYAQNTIDHTTILNNGINSHTKIDEHIAESTIHYTDVVTESTTNLRTKGGWVEFATSAKENSLPTQFTAGQFLQVASDGTRVWANPTDNAIEDVSPATGSFIRSKGSWDAFDPGNKVDKLANPTGTGTNLMGFDHDGTGSWVEYNHVDRAIYFPVNEAELKTALEDTTFEHKRIIVRNGMSYTIENTTVSGENRLYGNFDIVGAVGFAGAGGQIFIYDTVTFNGALTFNVTKFYTRHIECLSGTTVSLISTGSCVYERRGGSYMDDIANIDRHVWDNTNQCSKSMTVTAPESADVITMWIPDHKLRINKVKCVTDTGSAGFNLNGLFSTPVTANGTVSNHTPTSPLISADVPIKYTCTDLVGTPGEVTITIYYDEVY